jgi:hypothetical protein
MHCSRGPAALISMARQDRLGPRPDLRSRQVDVRWGQFQLSLGNASLPENQGLIVLFSRGRLVARRPFFDTKTRPTSLCWPAAGSSASTHNEHANSHRYPRVASPGGWVTAERRCRHVLSWVGQASFHSPDHRLSIDFAKRRVWHGVCKQMASR